MERVFLFTSLEVLMLQCHLIDPCKNGLVIMVTVNPRSTTIISKINTSKRWITLIAYSTKVDCYWLKTYISNLNIEKVKGGEGVKVF